MNPISTGSKSEQIWKGYDSEKVGEIVDLAAIRCDNGALYSRWNPTWKERFRILFGAKVWLGVLAEKQPPVTIGVGDLVENIS